MEAKERLLEEEWREIFLKCNVYPWNWGTLQPEYVFFQQPLVIIDDVGFQRSCARKKNKNKQLYS